MSGPRDLQEKIRGFYKNVTADEHSRYRSWEHCHRFFKSRTPDALATDKDLAALHLAFYLASWGMYRGSTFLLRRSYTVHIGVVEALASPKFSDLWKIETGSERAQPELVTAILQLVAAVKGAYKPFGKASDVLATKVILGTIGCLPAVDRFFIAGFRKSGRRYSRLNRAFVERIIQFCSDSRDGLRLEQARILSKDGIYYPLMKLADMYFWQTGLDPASPKARRDFTAGPSSARGNSSRR